MDPLLQELSEEGGGDDEVELILKLRAGSGVSPNVRIVTRFGDIATCRVRRRHIAGTWASEAVVSAKAPRLVAAEVEPPLVEAADLLGDALPDAPLAGATGRGVVVGLVDWGIDVAHPNFRRADGSTRLLALWDQAARGGAVPMPYGYGQVHDRAAIDRALATADPYAALRYHPADSDPFGDGAHGTHVCDIAAGNGRAPGSARGIAPDAELVFVHLATTGAEGLATLGDTCRILEALDFVGRMAGPRPWVVNLSVGRCGGPHNGRTLVEQGMDQLLLQAPGRAIVQSTGNYYASHGHAGGQLRPGERRTLTWLTDPADRTPNELEIWYPGLDELTLELQAPDGALVARVPLDGRQDVTAGGRVCGRVHHRSHDPSNGDHHVDIFLWPGAPAGAWRVTLVGTDVVDGRFDAWVERDSSCAGCQSRFDARDAVATRTTGTICNALRTIAVGAYDSRRADRPLAPFSSAGPTRDGRQKPDLAAPGVRIRAARSASRAGEPAFVTVKSGTSMAAPHVTGTIACMFEATPRPLWIHETRRLLLGSTQLAARDGGVPPELATRLGSGYLDAAGAIAAAREVPTTTAPVPRPTPDQTWKVAMSMSERSSAESPYDEALGFATSYDAAEAYPYDGPADLLEQPEPAPPPAPPPPPPPPPAPAVPPYGGYDLRRDDRDDRRRWGGAVRSAALGNVLPAPGTRPFVEQLQRDLAEMGFRIVGAADGGFGRATEWAVREFQIHAAMQFVAQEAPPPAPPATAPARYVDRLARVPNTQVYAGRKSGVVNADTRAALRHWLANRWRCPVVVEAWDVNAAGARTVLRNENVWRHDEVRVPARRMFVRDFSRYYTLPAGRNADDLVAVGHFAPFGAFGGPASESRAFAWPEAEMLPEHLVGRALAALSPAERSTYKVIRAVSEVENNGFFDVINAYDDVILSLGPYHWPVGDVRDALGDLPAYLAYLRHAEAADFTQAVGFFGARPTREWVRPGQPDGRSLFAAGSRRHLAWLEQEAEGAAFTALPGALADANYFRSWHWFYRFIMAARTITGFRRRIWDHARRRVRDVLETPWGAGVPNIPLAAPPGASRPATIGDVFTSERAIALLVRWHVRCPAHVVSAGRAGDHLRAAFGRAAIPAAAGDPTRWTDAHELRLINGIMDEVRSITTGCGAGGLVQTMTAVHDWPAWAPGPTPPPPPNPWRYTLDPTIGRLSAARSSLQLDTTGLPPAVAPAPPPPPPPGTGGGSGGGGGSGVGPGAIGLAEAILHDEALPVTASRVVAAVLAPAAEVWGEAEAGPVSVPYAPALLYEAFAGRRDSARRSDIGGRFQALALPRMRPDTPLAAGDLFVRRPAGEGSLAHAGLLLTGELVRHGELACRGWAAERSAPGWYALVVEGGPFPHCAHRPFARRILDGRGAVPPGQLLLRARTRTRLHAPASGENLGALTTGEAPTAMQLTVRNRLLRWDAIAGCEVELTHHDFDTPVLARTDAHGQAQLDLQGVRDGSYNMYVRPPHGSADPVGPALAATTPRPARIWRPLTTVVTVKDARIVASSDPRVIPAGAALTILVQPVWIASPNESARPGGAAALTRIIVHHTSGPLIGPALNTALAAKPPAGEPRRSAHYFIDTDGEIVKMVHEERASWHAGVAHWGGRDDLNDTTVGIEIVHQRGTYPAAQYDALIGLLQRIRAAYPAIAATSIVGHSDIGTCPLPGGPDGCNQPPRRLGRKSGDPGLDFEWERLEAQGLGIVVPAATTLAASAYGGFFAAVPDGRLQPNDRDTGHRYGGAARPSITTDVIRELQRDLRDIGYYCPDSGRYDVPTQRAVRTFQEHFFAGTRPRAAHAGEVDAATAERIKAVRPAPVAPVAPVVPAPAVPLQQEAAVAPAPPQGAAAELHRVTTRLPLTGKRVRVTKSIDARTGAIEIVAADAASGARVDLAALREAERRAHAARYGKLHPTLFRELQRHRPTDAIPIAIWVHVEEPVVDKGAHLESRAAPPLVANREDYDEASTGRTGEPTTIPTSTPPPAPLLAYRGIVAEARARVRQELEQRLHVPVRRELQTVPLLMTTATREQIRAVGQVRDVDAIYLHDERGVNDLGTSMVDSRADRAVDVMGWRGTNIRVAVWEPGPDDLTQLQVAEHFVAARTETATHARLTTAIIKNRQTTGPKGYAPDCLMYSANNYTLEALEWAVVTKECTVVNQSFHRDAEQTDGTLSLDDRVKDYLAVHWPFPTIIQAAGNSGTPGTEYVNHKGYNSLTVGNHLDGATRIDAQSVFRNPTSPHGDRELPEITANGDSVTAAGHTDSGTSFAAPAVAGAAALLQNADNALIHWPEGVRAILLAAADRNLEGKGWWQDVAAKVDAKDGSGVLDAAESVRIALSRRRPGAPAAQRGWDVGNLLPTDFDATGRATFAYQVAVPASETNPKHVKVALAWNAATTHTPASGSTPRAATSELTLDHDLLVFDGTRMVAASGSYDNSYEIAEFEGQPGRSYTIVIRRALTAPAERTWYGVAWTAP